MMKDYLMREKDIILSILSGALAGIAFTFESISLIMWIAFIPLIYILLIKENKYKEIFKYWFLFGVTYYLIILHWIFNLYPFDWINLTTKESIIILVLGWILISVVEAAIIAIVLGIGYFIKTNNSILNVLSIASLWSITEYVQELGVLGFPWGRLAISQVNNLSIIQSVSLFGSLFIGFLIMIFNGLLVIAIINYKSNRQRAIKFLMAAIILFLLNIFYGCIRLYDAEMEDKINVTIIQGNIDSAQKWKKEDERKNLELYKSLTDIAVNSEESFKPEMIIWPETAIPIDISKTDWILEEYRELAIKYNTLFMTGTFYKDVENESNEYNSMVSINKKGEIEQIYYKRHLVPFGEILPFERQILKISPKLKNLNLFNGKLKAGVESMIIDNTNIKIGSLICFDSIFAKLARESVNNGAEIFIIATNDSWFKDSKAIHQHNKNAILRAVENNRYVARAANTGISCAIDNRGRILKELEPLKRGYINTYVMAINENSIYTKIGDILIIINIISLAIIFLIKNYHNRMNKVIRKI